MMTSFHRRLLASVTASAALLLTLATNPTASSQTNTKTGMNAGISISTGTNNTADGSSALQFDLTGGENVAVGANSLKSDTAGGYNTAVGYGALTINTASYNTAVGADTLYGNTSGTDNVAVGYTTLYANGTGNYNTAVGVQALRYTTSGASNLAAGYQALFRNTTGGLNVGLGDGALLSNTTGSSNIAVGEDAGYNLTTGSNNISIGNKGVAGESGIIRIGTTGTHTDTYLTGAIHGDDSLEVTGSVSSNGKTAVVGDETDLRMVRGTWTAGASGAGWTSTSPAAGMVTITFATAFSSPPSVTASIYVPGGGDYGFLTVATTTTAQVNIEMRGAKGNLNSNYGFHFIAVGPR